MENFFKATKYLWEVSRVLLIILFGSAISSDIIGTNKSDIIILSLFAIFILSMITISFLKLIKINPHYFLGFFTGGFIVLFGILISFLMFTYGTVNYELQVIIGVQLFPIWMILYGIYEIRNGISSLREVKIT